MIVPTVSQGQERRLSEEQEAALKAEAEAGEIRTIHDGVAWAKARGVDYSYWGMRWVFYRLGLKKKVPRRKAPQASANRPDRHRGLDRG